MRLGVLCSIVRKEEKLIFGALRERGVDFEKIDDRELSLDLHSRSFPWDIVLERSVNHARALHTLKLFNDRGLPTINTWDVANICGDKVLTTNALIQAQVPTPKTIVAYTPESALAAIETMGYRRSAPGDDSSPVRTTGTPLKRFLSTSRSSGRIITQSFISKSTWRRVAETSEHLSWVIKPSVPSTV